MEPDAFRAPKDDEVVIAPKYDHELLRQEFIKIAKILTEHNLFTEYGDLYDYRVGSRGYSVYISGDFVEFSLYEYADTGHRFMKTPIYSASYIKCKILSYSVVDMTQDEIIEQLLLFVLMLK
jgi:hypothetical protein